MSMGRTAGTAAVEKFAGVAAARSTTGAIQRCQSSEARSRTRSTTGTSGSAASESLAAGSARQWPQRLVTGAAHLTRFWIQSAL